jgi:hypothetical protein
MAQLYMFLCPRCSAEITVDAPVQDELLSSGCIYCNAVPSPTDFSRE